jgi:hypothetical protein
MQVVGFLGTGSPHVDRVCDRALDPDCAHQFVLHWHMHWKGFLALRMRTVRVELPDLQA